MNEKNENEVIVQTPMQPVPMPAQRMDAPSETGALAVVQMFLTECRGMVRNEAALIDEFFREAELSGLTDPRDPDKGVFFYSWKQGGGYVEGATVKATDYAARLWGLSQQFMVYDIFVPTQVKDADNNITVVNKPFLEFHVYTFDMITKRFNHCVTRQAKKVNVGEWAKKNEESMARADANVFAIGYSKASRNGYVHAIGKHIFDEAVKIAKGAVVKGISRVSGNLDASLEKCFQTFESEFGVDSGRIIAYLGREPRHMTDKDLTHLRGVFTRIADDNEDPDVIFPPAASEAELVPDVEPSIEDAKVVADAKRPEKTTRAKPKTRNCVFCNGMFHKDDVVKTAHPSEKGEEVDICRECYKNRNQPKADNPTPVQEPTAEEDAQPAPQEEVSMIMGECNAFCDPGEKETAPAYNDIGEIYGHYCSPCQQEANIHCKGTNKIKGCGRYLTAIHKAGDKLIKRKDGVVCTACITGVEVDGE